MTLLPLRKRARAAHSEALLVGDKLIDTVSDAGRHGASGVFAMGRGIHCPLLHLGVDRQLRGKSPLVGWARFAAGDIGSQVRKFVQDARRS
jgi:hypothetical protein